MANAPVSSFFHHTAHPHDSSERKDEMEANTSSNKDSRDISVKVHTSQTLQTKSSEQSTDPYSDKPGYATSDCEADTESVVGEADHLLISTHPGVVTDNSKTSDVMEEDVDGTVPDNETDSSAETVEATKKRKYEVNTKTYHLRSQKKRKIDTDAQPEKENFKVLDITTKFDRDVLKQLRDRCAFLGIDPGFYKDVGGTTLLTTIVVRETELTRYENLTDTTVISLLEDKRIMLNACSKCPYCRREFEGNPHKTKSGKTYTDQIYSLLTCKPGESHIFPDEPKQEIAEKGKRKKKLLTKKQRESVLKTHIVAKCSEEEDNSDIEKSEKNNTKKEIEVRKVELKAKVATDEARSNISVPPDEKLLEKTETVAEIPESPHEDDVVKEIVSPVVLGREGKPLLNLKFMKKPKIVPSEEATKKKEVVGKEHATALNDGTCGPTDTCKEVVLLVKGGKMTSNLGKGNIGKNVGKVSEFGSTGLKPLSDASQKKSPYVTKIVPKRNMEAVTYVTPPSMKEVCKEQRNEKRMPVSKSQQDFGSVASEGNSQENQEEKKVKLDSFEKAFGGSILRNQLSRTNVDDEYHFHVEKDRESLAVLKTLINSHFVRKKERDYENLKYELKRLKLQSYFPKGIVVKEGFDILQMICEILPGNTPANLRKSLCGFLHDNIEYFSTLFKDDFAPKESNIYDYIGKLIRTSTVPDHNAIFALSKMLKQSIFIVRVRHVWKSEDTPNIDIVLGHVGNRHFYPVTLHPGYSYRYDY